MSIPTPSMPGVPAAGNVGGIQLGDLFKSIGTLEFQPVPPGEYTVQVVTSTFAQSSTGRPMWKTQLQILNPGPYAGRKVYNNITLVTDNPNALRMFFVNMKAMGLDETFWASNPSPEYVAQILMNRQFVVILDNRDYRGQMRENVVGIKPMAGVSAGLPAGPAGVVPGGAVAPVAAPIPTAVATPQPAQPVAAAPVAAPPAPAPEPVAVQPVQPVAPEPQPVAPIPTLAEVQPAPVPAPVPASAPVAEPQAAVQPVQAVAPAPQAGTPTAPPPVPF